ncbi:MAG: hypothetical protein EOM18_09955 [Clostridia bacterium]|nr:hypothetical protein [Clostridia bacterium]
MNIAFMEKIFCALYEDPIGEFGKNCEEYEAIRKQAYFDIDRTENLAKHYGKEMEDMLQTMLDSITEKTEAIVKRAYIRGALDREKMLR